MRAFARILVAVKAALLLSVSPAFAQVPEHDLKAAFIYNFVQFTQWPEMAMKGGTLSLCASPGTMLYMALQRIAGRTAHGRLITLNALTGAVAGDCHVVVATTEDHERIGQIKRLLVGKAVLSITDAPELQREGMIIGMSLDGGKIVFNVDNTHATESGLTVSSRLLRLARSVR